MTKADLIEEVSRVVEITRKESEVIVEAIFDSIVRSLRGGDKIEIRGFGSFRTRQRQPRIGRNPKTGARVEVPAKKIPYFKPSKELKDVVNNSAAQVTPAATQAPPSPDQVDNPEDDPSMDYLWTPWRYQYIRSSGMAEECVFCAAAADAGNDEARLVVHRASHCFVILNRYPYTSGHVMLVPYAHVGTLDALPQETALEMMRLAQRTESILRALYRPDGLNFGMNIGKAAGAGIAAHIHMHALPRWAGDANFMTTVGETRVLPEDLSETWRKIRIAFENAIA